MRSRIGVFFFSLFFFPVVDLPFFTPAHSHETSTAAAEQGGHRRRKIADVDQGEATMAPRRRLMFHDFIIFKIFISRRHHKCDDPSSDVLFQRQTFFYSFKKGLYAV